MDTIFKIADVLQILAKSLLDFRVDEKNGGAVKYETAKLKKCEKQLKNP